MEVMMDDDALAAEGAREVHGNNWQHPPSLPAASDYFLLRPVFLPTQTNLLQTRRHEWDS